MSEIELQKIITVLKQCRYTVVQTFNIGTEAKFLLLYSSLQRKPLVVDIDSEKSLYSGSPDHILEPTECNYRNYRQREYLSKIDLQNVACLSSENIALKKNGEVFDCYLFLNEGKEPETDSDLELSEDDDIEVDEHPVEDIYPLYRLSSLLDEPSNFEETVLKDHLTIVEAEEEINETEVQKLLAIFDSQKRQLKARIFEIHEEAYNIRRDIAKFSINLQRIYSIKERSENERDRVRFKIERMALEAEEKIDHLNEKLRQKRNQSDLLLKKYQKYIEQFQ